MGGKVEGPVYGEHAARSVGRALARCGFEVRDEPHAVAECDVDLRRQQRRLGSRVPQRLAHLARDEMSELGRPLPRGVAEAAQHGGARLETGVAPGREGLPRPRYGDPHRALVGDRIDADLVCGIRR
jgi:hypothetical protein